MTTGTDITIELLDESCRPAIFAMLDDVERDAGHPPLSEAKSLALRGGRGIGLVARRGEEPVAYAHLAENDDGWDVQFAVHPSVEAPTDVAQLVTQAALDEAARRGAELIRLWAFHADEDSDALAEALGLRPGRELFQMRRPLPHPDDPEPPADVVLREFRPGEDDSDWLAVNARAFADHPDQGRWTQSDLEARFDEPWFDSRGFLLAEHDGELAGFCWTKVHERHGVGEIYVIGTDPEHRGIGLGNALVLAGLDALSRAGVRTATLYVDADNDAAVNLYQQLGFDIDHVDRVYQGTP